MRHKFADPVRVAHQETNPVYSQAAGVALQSDYRNPQKHGDMEVRPLLKWRGDKPICCSWQYRGLHGVGREVTASRLVLWGNEND